MPTPIPCSPTILSLVMWIFLYLEAFESNTTSEWLNRTVLPIRICFTFTFTNKTLEKRMMKRIVGEYRPSMPCLSLPYKTVYNFVYGTIISDKTQSSLGVTPLALGTLKIEQNIPFSTNRLFCTFYRQSQSFPFPSGIAKTIVSQIVALLRFMLNTTTFTNLKGERVPS